ncbi:membrane protein DedA with SNARE-associated domain [Naumannella cuiyingiana]|uniref:Membrane protein DedA with SNARE-associated domain n=1 Tax=Naumannella cuiyingiana TaxID=1347891 RepID=A0A7Z0D6Q0_9ACTN|nr:DedA family protein [Naumannella cuiyingiana]NYI69855.1 membrane protein DedA with SNARE-associated domain [Naumannella cuiyingiana]
MNQIVDWLVGLMDTIGPMGAGLAVALENLFPPIPSEAILPLAGFAAARGSFSVLEAIVWTTAGSVVGAYLLYAVGAAVGRDRMRWLAAKLPLVDVADLDKTEAWFHRHGPKAVFFGRMIPIFRSLISIPAGITRMPPVLFGLLTLAGSAIWNSVFVIAGYYLGANWAVVEQYASIFQKIVIVLVAAAVVIWVVRRIRARHGHRAATEAQARDQEF